MAPQSTNARDAEPLLLLRDSLAAFRDDLDALFQAQHRHNTTRRQLQDLYVRLLWSSQRTEPAAASVGIAGVGKLSDDSPSSKGARAKRNSISLDSFGGEHKLREMVMNFLASDEMTRSTYTAEDTIQDIWADTLDTSSARVSALIARNGMGSDCRQFALVKDGLRRELMSLFTCGQ